MYFITAMLQYTSSLRSTSSALFLTLVCHLFKDIFNYTFVIMKLQFTLLIKYLNVSSNTLQFNLQSRALLLRFTMLG